MLCDQLGSIVLTMAARTVLSAPLVCYAVSLAHSPYGDATSARAVQDALEVLYRQSVESAQYCAACTAQGAILPVLEDWYCATLMMQLPQ